MLTPPEGFWNELQDGLPPGTRILVQSINIETNQRVWIPATVLTWCEGRRAIRLPGSLNGGQEVDAYGHSIAFDECALDALGLDAPRAFADLSCIRPYLPHHNDTLAIVGVNYEP